jgi:hypothetical protein
MENMNFDADMDLTKCPLVAELGVNMALVDSKYFLYQQEGDVLNSPFVSGQLLLNRCGICLKCADPKIAVHCLRDGAAWEDNGNYLGIETSGMIETLEDI